MTQHKLTYNDVRNLAHDKRVLNLVASVTAFLGLVLAICAETHIANAMGIEAWVPVVLLALCPLLGLVGMVAASRSDNNVLFVFNVCVFLAVFILTMAEFVILLSH